MPDPLARIPFLTGLLFIAACSREARSPVRQQSTALLAADASVPSEPVYDPCPPAPAQCLIMPLGDSTTAGTDNHGGYRGELYRLLQATGRPFDFVGSQPAGGLGSGQEGHPGMHIDNLTGYLELYMTTYKPNVILLLMGVNDVDYMYTAHIATYGKILDQISVLLPQSLVVVGLVTPNTATVDVTAPHTPTRDVTIAFNAALMKEVNTRIAAGKHLMLVDHHSALRSRDIGPDGIHPVPAGYARMAQVWYSVLSRFMRPKD
ncbi:MAG: GDSL-type esterase/lipase family protein [Myxococcales bacterium]